MVQESEVLNKEEYLKALGQLVLDLELESAEQKIKIDKLENNLNELKNLLKKWWSN